MMHMAISVLAGTALVAFLGMSEDKPRPEAATSKTQTSLHDFTVHDIDGEAVSLSKYRGQVCLVVNVASR